MKKILLTIGLVFLLTGCGDSIKKATDDTTDVPKISGELKKATDEQIDEFNEKNKNKSHLDLNDKQKSVDLTYLSDDHKKIIQNIADDLYSPMNYKSAVFLADDMQKNSQDFFEKTNNEITINLLNPDDAEKPLYKVSKNKIEYPAFTDANNGEVPEEIKNIDGILKTADYMYSPKGKSNFNYKDKTIDIEFNVDQNEFDKDSELKDKFIATTKDTAITLFDTIKKVYNVEYPIVFKKGNDILFTVKDGNIIDGTW